MGSSINNEMNNMVGNRKNNKIIQKSVNTKSVGTGMSSLDYEIAYGHNKYHGRSGSLMVNTNLQNKNELVLPSI